jgi:RNA polymerase sigma factor (sigma-70 family)
LEVEEVPVVKFGAYKKYSDPELVGMCLEGDSRAWETLIRRHRRLIYSIPLKFGYLEPDLSDIFQFVCLKLLEHLHELKDDRKVSGWLATTTSRQCLAIRVLKQRESGTEDEVEEPEDPAGTLEDIKLLAEKYQLLRDSIQQLPPRCRTMIEMLYLDSKQPSYEEIAEELGIPVPSVGPSRARCLDKLRVMLQRQGIKK